LNEKTIKTFDSSIPKKDAKYLTLDLEWLKPGFYRFLFIFAMK